MSVRARYKGGIIFIVVFLFALFCFGWDMVGRLWGGRKGNLIFDIHTPFVLIILPFVGNSLTPLANQVHCTL